MSYIYGNFNYSNTIKNFFYEFSEPLYPTPIIHTCKNGKQVCLNYHNPYGKNIPKMEDSHLLKTISFLKKRAKEGVKVRDGGGGVGSEDMWYDEDFVFGKKAKKILNYKKYKNEAIKRGLIKSKK
jgi:hypothetical protein